MECVFVRVPRCVVPAGFGACVGVFFGNEGQHCPLMSVFLRVLLFLHVTPRFLLFLEISKIPDNISYGWVGRLSWFAHWIFLTGAASRPLRGARWST